jgi:hypothetical protein
MSKKALTITLFLAVIVFSSLFGVIGKEAMNAILPTPSPNSDAEIVSSTGFRKIHERNYLEGCIKAGSSEEYCDCSFNNFKEAYTPKELTVMAEKFKTTGELDERMIKVRESCQHLK